MLGQLALTGEQCSLILQLVNKQSKKLLEIKAELTAEGKKRKKIKINPSTVKAAVQDKFKFLRQLSTYYNKQLNGQTTGTRENTSS